MTNAELVLRWSGGELDLMGWNDSAHGEFEIGTLADGTEWGNPQSVRRTLRRFLLDGSVSVKDYDDNRTIPLKLRLKAPDGTALAGGEAALVALDSHRCELVWTPPDAFAAPAVYVAVSVDLAHSMDDLGELRLERYYTLTLDCLPHAYSDEWVEVPALPQDISVRTEFDDCSTLTNWTSFQVSLTDGGADVWIKFPDGTDDGIAARNGTVDFTTDRYLAITYTGLVGKVVKVEVLSQASGSWVEVPRVGTDSWAVHLYDVGMVVSGIAWTFERPLAYVGFGELTAARITSLGKQATPRASASNGQVRTVAVPGSRRTPTRVEASSATGGLGEVILYSGPDYDPSLSLRLAPGYVAEVGTGGFAGPDTETTLYKWPISELPPGRYVAWALLDTAVTGGDASLEFKAELHTTAGLAREAMLATIPLPPDTGFTLMPLFSADLPGWDVAEGTAHEFGLRVTASGTATSISAEFPWFWLFNVSEGTLFVVDAAGDHKVWVEPASIERDHQSILTGDTTLPDALPRSLSSEVLSWGASLSLVPPLATIYSWSSDATDMMVSARFRPAWHTHPAPLS